ncbi:MAG: hypothetical protein ACI4M9_05145, partial [Succinivibrio sp.]
MNSIIDVYELMSSSFNRHKSLFCFTITAYVLACYGLSNKNVGLLCRKDHRKVQTIVNLAMSHYLSPEELKEKSKSRPRTILIDSILANKKNNRYSTPLVLYTYFHRSSPYKTFDTNAFLISWIILCAMDAKEKGISSKAINYKIEDLDINLFFTLCYSMRERSESLTCSNYATLSFSKRTKSFYAHCVVDALDDSCKVMSYEELNKFLCRKKKREACLASSP